MAKAKKELICHLVHIMYELELPNKQHCTCIGGRAQIQNLNHETLCLIYRGALTPAGFASLGGRSHSSR